MAHVTNRFGALLPRSNTASNRSLFLDRLVVFKEDDQEYRMANTRGVTASGFFSSGSHAWEDFLLSLPARKLELRIGTQVSHLMVNTAGGVFENGGLALHRNFGIPVIPGSALKGVTRHAVLWEMRARTADENAVADEEWLRFFRVFGHTEGDLHRDIGYVLGTEASVDDDTQEDRIEEAIRRVAAEMRSKSCSGSVSFLPAFPKDKPDLVPDILTNHHEEHYNNPRSDFARDIEEPNPLVYPTVAPGISWFFALLADRRRAAEEDLAWVADWLADALTVIGVGAKTGSGYGRFDFSEEEPGAAVSQWRQSKEHKRKQQLADEEQAKMEEVKKRKREEKEAADAELEKLPPEERAKRWFSGLADGERLRCTSDRKAFLKLDEERQEAVILGLAETFPELWQRHKEALQGNLKPKDKKNAQSIDSELRRVSNKLGGILK